MLDLCQCFVFERNLVDTTTSIASATTSMQDSTLGE